jgi:cytidyltransferase-like protein
MKIGVLGGTFDPIHIGHLRVAEEVTAHLGLDEVIFMPAGQPWLKGDNLISPAEHRQEMLRLALAGKSYFLLSTMEAAIPGLSEGVILLEAPRIDVNASEIRRMVARGLSIDHLVPEAVAGYIKGHKLYPAKGKKPH